MKRWDLWVLFFLLLAGAIITLRNPLPLEDQLPLCQPGQIPYRDEAGKWICITLMDSAK
jgi:hypothetical protein